MTTVDLTQLSPEQLEDLNKQIKARKTQERKEQQEKDKLINEFTNEVVDNNIDFFVGLNASVEKGIIKVFKDAKALIELRAERYESKSEDQDSFTFTKKDGSASIRIGWNIKPTFTGIEAEGIKKIKQFMSSLAGDTDNEQLLFEFLNVALKTDAQGNYNPKKVRELNSMRQKANSELFDSGMDIIDSAIVDVRTSQFVRGHKMVEVEEGLSKRIEFNFSFK